MSRCFVGSSTDVKIVRPERSHMLPSNALVDQAEEKAVPRFVGKTMFSFISPRTLRGAIVQIDFRE